jgi:hypothetical protein
MSNISGTNLAAKIVPFTTDDIYSTHEDIYGLGGFVCVADVSTRNAIQNNRRKQGMKVSVISDGITYELRDGILNTNWIPYGPNFYSQSTQPLLSIDNTFSFWRDTSTSQIFIINRANGIQRRAELNL